MVKETFKLINTIKKLYPVQQFFKNRYFPDGQVYYSEKALIETKRQGKKIAPFVVPVVDGIVMESEGYRAMEVDAPYIAPKMPITAKELEKKAFGENPNSPRTPAERENEIEAEHIDELRNAIYRRHEKMCTELVCTGQLLMKHYSTAEDAAKDVNADLKELRFFDTEFSNRYKLKKKFADMTTKEKVIMLYDMATVLRKRGFRATDLVMTADVSMQFITDKEFLDLYDKDKVNFGNIEPKELPEGVVYNGTININGVVMNIITYDNTFEDLDGTEKEMLPAGTIAFLQPGLGETAYAQVTFIKGENFHSYAERIVPRIVSDEKTNMIEVQMFSRPIPYPYHCDSWLVANIYDTVAEPDKKSDSDTQNVNDQQVQPSENDEITLKSEEEINAMTTKAPLIEYGKYIGMSDEQVNTNMKVDELKTAILNYQGENYPEDTP